jgi:hypothetical protein
MGDRARLPATAACRRRRIKIRDSEAFLKTHTVAKTTTDFDGRGSFRVPPDNYHLFGSFKAFNKTIVWNVPVGLASGSNSIILDQANAQIACDIASTSR